MLHADQFDTSVVCAYPTSGNNKTVLKWFEQAVRGEAFLFTRRWTSLCITLIHCIRYNNLLLYIEYYSTMSIHLGNIVGKPIKDIQVLVQAYFLKIKKTNTIYCHCTRNTTKLGW